MKILHVSQPVTEGVARWVSLLAADQVRRGWDVVVACPADSWLAREVADVGAVHVPWNATRSPGPTVVSETRSLSAIVKYQNPDVVHLHSSKAGLAGRLAIRKRRPTIFQPHSWSFNAVHGPVAVATKLWERLGAKWTTKIVCVSEQEKQEGVALGIDEGSVDAIHNGIDLEKWPLATDELREAARSRLQLADGPIAVCVGRLSQQKGQDLLLGAWPKVLTTVPDAHLYLVGDGPMREELESKARSMSGVTLLGLRDDVNDWLVASNVVVLPSRWEGLALSVLEACASARSVVATDVAGMTEVVGLGESSGGAIVGLEPELNFESRLSAALSKRLSSPGMADEEGLRGRERVSAEFQLSSALESTAALAERCCSDERS